MWKRQGDDLLMGMLQCSNSANSATVHGNNNINSDAVHAHGIRASQQNVSIVSETSDLVIMIAGIVFEKNACKRVYIETNF